jgi:hypothetical protein
LIAIPRRILQFHSGMCREALIKGGTERRAVGPASPVSFAAGLDRDPPADPAVSLRVLPGNADQGRAARRGGLLDLAGLVFGAV